MLVVAFCSLESAENKSLSTIALKSNSSPRFSDFPSLQTLAAKTLCNHFMPKRWQEPIAQTITDQESYDFFPSSSGRSSGWESYMCTKIYHKQTAYDIWETGLFYEGKLSLAAEQRFLYMQLALFQGKKNIPDWLPLYFEAAYFAIKYLAARNAPSNDYEQITTLIKTAFDQKIKIGSNKGANKAIAFYQNEPIKIETISDIQKILETLSKVSPTASNSSLAVSLQSK